MTRRKKTRYRFYSVMKLENKSISQDNFSWFQEIFYEEKTYVIWIFNFSPFKNQKVAIWEKCLYCAQLLLHLYSLSDKVQKFIKRLISKPSQDSGSKFVLQVWKQGTDFLFVFKLSIVQENSNLHENVMVSQSR